MKTAKGEFLSELGWWAGLCVTISIIVVVGICTGMAML